MSSEWLKIFIVVGLLVVVVLIQALLQLHKTAQRQESLLVDKQRDRLLRRSGFYAEEWQRRQLKDHKVVVGSADKRREAMQYLATRYKNRGIPCPTPEEMEQDIESILPAVRQVSTGRGYDGDEGYDH